MSTNWRTEIQCIGHRNDGILPNSKNEWMTKLQQHEWILKVLAKYKKLDSKTYVLYNLITWNSGKGTTIWTGNKSYYLFICVCGYWLMLKRQLEGNLKVNNIGLCVNCVGSYYIYLSKYIDYTPKYVNYSV